MIEILLGPADLAATRFAYSPMEELVHSVRVVAGRQEQALNRPWLTQMKPRLAGMDLGLLIALMADARCIPDFLAPPMERMRGNFEEELQAIRGASDDAVRDALDDLRGDRPLPRELVSLYERPQKELGTLAARVSAYWKAVIEPVWPRLRAVLDADISHRMDQLATGGFAKVFSDLHQDVEYAGDRLRIDKPHRSVVRSGGGGGLLLVPCVFAWPGMVVLYNEPYQPALTYPPRGTGQVWAHSQDAGGAPIAELVGRNRALVLAHLDMPLSTSQLAAYLGMTPPAVSQHLAILRRCRLVSSRRAGRWVLYQRTPLGTHLLEAAHAA